MRKVRNTLWCALLATTAMIAPASADFNDRPPHGREQKPAFANQTRAPVIDDKVRLKTQIIADGLVYPWGMAELPDGNWLVTERSGALRFITPDGKKLDPIKGLPAVAVMGQGGLLDVVAAKDFAQTRQIWFSFAEPRGGEGNATAVGTGILSQDGGALKDVQVIFRQQPAYRGDKHFGSRLVFDDKGALFVTTGERSDGQIRAKAQDVATHLGKVLRIRPSGGPAAGNPVLPGGLPEIWSYGHRNIQAAALGPDGALWTVEHGPKGGDELNRIAPGKNYGWPIITYGLEYYGGQVGDGRTHQDGMEQPVYYWDPVIAPSGMAFYSSDAIAGWHGSILIGGLQSQSLVRLTLKDGKVTGEARYLTGIGRVRDVAVAKDGAIMLLTDAPNGKFIRVTAE